MRQEQQEQEQAQQIQLDEESEAYYNFINSLKSPFTKVVYKNRFSLFLKYCRLERYDSLLTSMSTEELRNKIVQYFVKRKGVSRGTQKVDLAVIKHFCEMNDIVLNWKKISKFMSSDIPRNTDRGYTHVEINKIIDYSDHRISTIFLVLASTGIRAGALRFIKRKLWKKSLKQECTN